MERLQKAQGGILVFRGQPGVLDDVSEHDGGQPAMETSLGRRGAHGIPECIARTPWSSGKLLAGCTDETWGTLTHTGVSMVKGLPHGAIPPPEEVRMRSSTVRRAILVSVAAIPALAVAPAGAQDGFLFDPPTITLSGRGGYNRAAAGSDVYDFFIRQLTLERSDFSGAIFLGELAVTVITRLDMVAGVGHASSTTPSESRTHVGTDGLPIAQTTTLRRTPVTASLKFYPMPRGRMIGSQAWIPARLTPFVGIGGGGLYYDLEQSGEFVDTARCDANDICEIFRSTLTSDGWTGTLHVMGGLDYWLTTRLGLSAEARYLWASAPLSASFVGFEDIDLSGFQGTVGLSVRL